MTLRIVSFAICNLDDSWYIRGQNRPLNRESWALDMSGIIEAKREGAGIDVSFNNDQVQHLKFKYDALVTIRGNLLAFDTSSLHQ